MGTRGRDRQAGARASHGDHFPARNELVGQEVDELGIDIEVFVGRLRKKMPADLIKTVRGLGYCLAPPDDEA